MEKDFDTVSTIADSTGHCGFPKLNSHVFILIQKEGELIIAAELEINLFLFTSPDSTSALSKISACMVISSMPYTIWKV